MRVGLVLVHYVGGSEEETEWVYTCSKRMRLSADKLWNATAVEAAQEMENLLAAERVMGLVDCGVPADGPSGQVDGFPADGRSVSDY